jgi:hypothetical protein
MKERSIVGTVSAENSIGRTCFSTPYGVFCRPFSFANRANKHRLGSNPVETSLWLRRHYVRIAPC